jgi:NADH-quinone oxidoreductase subunit C
MDLEAVRVALTAAVPGCTVEILPNPSPAAQHSLLVDAQHAGEIAQFLRDDAALRLDFCSNVTGMDWLAKDGSGYLEAVYHLYSMEKKHGPLVLRLRTQDRAVPAHLPSLTSVWRSAELQEREIFDLYGIHFDGHPDLRRLLMWDGFAGHPMRRDYVEPDDYEYEPTAHDAVLQKAQRHQAGMEQR